jgi:hypothetical protein
VHQLCQMCAEDGVVLLSTPEIGTALTSHSVGHSAWFFPPEHLHLISPLALRGLFAAQGFEVIGQGRVEVSTARFLARYGVGVVEMLLGAFVRWTAPALWQRWRNTRTQRFKGITWLAFARPAPGGSTTRPASTPA